MINLREHPRARAGIRRARFGGGLALAVLTALLAHGAGVPAQDVVLRALLAGVLGHLLAWAMAIAFYRAVAQGEIRVALAHREEAVRRAEERLAEEVVTEG